MTKERKKLFRVERVSPYYFENLVGLLIGGVGLLLAFLFALRIREARDAGMYTVIPPLIGLALLIGGAAAGAIYTALRQRGFRLGDAKWPRLTTLKGRGPDVFINRRLTVAHGLGIEGPLDFISRFVPGSDDAPMAMQILLQRYLRPLVVIVGLMLAYAVCLVFERNDLDAAIINLIYLGLLMTAVFQLARPEAALNRRVVIGTWLLAIVLPLLTSILPAHTLPLAVAQLSHVPTLMVFLSYAVTAAIFLYASTHFFEQAESSEGYAPLKIVSDAVPDSLFREARRLAESFGLLGAVYQETSPEIGNHTHGQFYGELLAESDLLLDMESLPSSPAEMLRIPRLRILAVLTAAAGLCWLAAFAIAWSIGTSLLVGTPVLAKATWLAATISIGWWSQQSAHQLWGWIPFTSRMVFLRMDGHYSRAATRRGDSFEGSVTERETLASDNAELRVLICDVESVSLGLSGARLPIAFHYRSDLASQLRDQIEASINGLRYSATANAGAPRTIQNAQAATLPPRSAA